MRHAFYYLFINLYSDWTGLKQVYESALFKTAIFQYKKDVHIVEQL